MLILLSVDLTDLELGTVRVGVVAVPQRLGLAVDHAALWVAHLHQSMRCQHRHQLHSTVTERVVQDYRPARQKGLKSFHKEAFSIIIMDIYHELINALSAHIIHINLIFYTDRESTVLPKQFT